MIPKIIHQIWEGKTEPLPEQLLLLSKTWQTHHPAWQYKFWNGESMEAFVQEHFPEFAETYFGYRYAVQRWDAIRYLILYKMGGLYADLDYECLEPLDNLLQGKTCCFGMDPEEHAKMFRRTHIVTNAIMASAPGHPFMKRIIEQLPEVKSCATDKATYVLETTGLFFITDTYDAYPQKDEIYLFPTALTAPLTQKEVLLYRYGEIDDATMELKLEKAVAVHYFFDSWYMKTDVLYLSTANGNGGAPRAAYRIHCGLLDSGVNSVMMVRTATGERRNVYVAPFEKHDDNIRSEFLSLKDYTLVPGIHFSPAVAGIDLQKHVDSFNPEIVQLHWINGGFIRIEDLKEVKRKIVWRFPDCWPMTGGCHYFGDCTGYMRTCGKCPQLTSDNENDLSHEVWQRKYSAWKDVDMTVVVPTPWMKEVTQKSSLFGNHRIEVIPNGLDTTLFSPLDKKSARKVLGLPLDKKIILYGAFYATQDKRKGFSLLEQALQRIAERHRDEYELLVFGANSVETVLNLPVKFMGILQDHLSLQIAYSSADTMVVPSTQEAFGQTVIEAMACAVPVVAFTGTGPGGIVEHKHTGYLAQYNDAEDLARGIEWVLEEHPRRETLCGNARERVLKTYDIRLIAQQYIRLYDSLKSPLITPAKV